MQNIWFFQQRENQNHMNLNISYLIVGSVRLITCVCSKHNTRVTIERNSSGMQNIWFFQHKVVYENAMVQQNLT
jgi:hypothetical protein